MIPVRWHRIVIVLLGVSLFLAGVDVGLRAIGLTGFYLEFGSGLAAGFVVFMMAIEGGVLLRFCAKGLVKPQQISSITHEMMSSVGCGKLGIRVTPMDSDSVFAVTVSEGFSFRTFISRGLLVKFSTEGIRGVAAHECGHVMSGHTKRLATLLGLIAAVKFSVGVPLMASVAVLLSFLWLLRQWEYEADARAVSLVGADALITAFADYEKATGKSDAGGDVPVTQGNSPNRSWRSGGTVLLDAFLELFMGHPRIEHRVERIVKRSNIK